MRKVMKSCMSPIKFSQATIETVLSETLYKNLQNHNQIGPQFFRKACDNLHSLIRPKTYLCSDGTLLGLPEEKRTGPFYLILIDLI